MPKGIPKYKEQKLSDNRIDVNRLRTDRLYLLDCFHKGYIGISYVFHRRQIEWLEDKFGKDWNKHLVAKGLGQMLDGQSLYDSSLNKMFAI